MKSIQSIARNTPTPSEPRYNRTYTDNGIKVYYDDRDFSTPEEYVGFAKTEKDVGRLIYLHKN